MLLKTPLLSPEGEEGSIVNWLLKTPVLPLGGVREGLSSLFSPSGELERG